MAKPRPWRRIFRAGDEIAYSFTLEAVPALGLKKRHYHGTAIVLRKHGEGYEVRTPSGEIKLLLPQWLHPAAKADREKETDPGPLTLGEGRI